MMCLWQVLQTTDFFYYKCLVHKDDQACNSFWGGIPTSSPLGLVLFIILKLHFTSYLFCGVCLYNQTLYDMCENGVKLYHHLIVLYERGPCIFCFVVCLFSCVNSQNFINYFVHLFKCCNYHERLTELEHSFIQVTIQW